MSIHRLSWLSALVLAAASVGFAHASEVVVGTGEYPPYISESADDNGCVISIVKNAFEAEGWTIDLRFMPWPRNLTALSRGQIDASAFWLDQPERRENYIFPKNPVAAEVYKFVFAKDGVIDWNTYEDLRGKTIIIINSYTYSEEFYEALEKYDIRSVAVSAESQSLRMLLRGRADLAIMNDKVFEKYMAELSQDEQSRLYLDPKTAIALTGFLIFTRADSDKSKMQADVFDKGYEKIRQRSDLRESFETCGL